MSEVHCPAIMMNSFSDHKPVWGSMASFVYFVMVYIMQTASMAAGHLAAA